MNEHPQDGSDEMMDLKMPGKLQRISHRCADGTTTPGRWNSQGKRSAECARQ